MNANSHNQNSKPRTVIRGLRRPNWICRNVKQNVVFVRDTSPSMRGRKAKDASAAGLDLAAELANPANKDGFHLAVVDFSASSKVVHDLQPATALNGNVKPLTVGLFSGGTNITAGFEEALTILQGGDSTKQKAVAFLRPVVLCFSDGCHNTGPSPEAVAGRLKAIADLVTVAFGDDADESLLRALASTSQHYYRCSSGRDLRSFLAKVGATMTATMAAGTNATQALTTVQG